MIDPAGRLHDLALAERVISVGNRVEQPGTQSFAAELADKLAGTTNSNPALPSSLPAGQQSVTWRDPGGSTSGTKSQPSGLQGLVITYPDTTSSESPTAAPSSTQPMSFDEAYWASQPPAVQQLQYIQNPSERTQVATQLAQEGYSIDVPIMAWGWDPATTTAARQSMGYTWVPSADQPSVDVAPGLTFGSTAYNPAQPPAGSIAV
jgi:hypothetical protein